MAIVATIVGIMVLAAAAHYYYTTYNNAEQTQQYNEPYKPPDEYWKPRQEYEFEDNSVQMFPESSYVHKSPVKFTTPKTNENDLLSDPQSVNEIKSTTTREETSSQESTPPYSTDKPQSTSMGHGIEIEYAVGLPHDVNIRTLHQPKKYYNYKINSETKFNEDRSEVEFVGVEHTGARDRIKIPDKEKPDKKTTDYPIPSRASTMLGNFLKMVMVNMVMVLLP